MNYVLKKIDPLSAAKLIAISAALFMAVYVVIALAVVTALGIELGPQEGPFVQAAPWMLLVMPFAYLIGVYLVTLLVCLIFNALAGWLGGIRIELGGS